jgi:hypothetical protein
MKRTQNYTREILVCDICNSDIMFIDEGEEVNDPEDYECKVCHKIICFRCGVSIAFRNSNSSGMKINIICPSHLDKETNEYMLKMRVAKEL